MNVKKYIVVFAVCSFVSLQSSESGKTFSENSIVSLQQTSRTNLRDTSKNTAIAITGFWLGHLGHTKLALPDKHEDKNVRLGQALGFAGMFTAGVGAELTRQGDYKSGAAAGGITLATIGLRRLFSQKIEVVTKSSLHDTEKRGKSPKKQGLTAGDSDYGSDDGFRDRPSSQDEVHDQESAEKVREVRGNNKKVSFVEGEQQ